MGADLFGSYVATVLAAMVLGNYVIKDMGGKIDDAFGGIGPILLPMAIAGFGILFSIIGTMLVKIASDDAKEAQVQKSIKYWELGFYCINFNFFVISWLTLCCQKY